MEWCAGSEKLNCRERSATALFMSAPLLGVDKELKNNVPPPRATSGMPFFRWDFN